MDDTISAITPQYKETFPWLICDRRRPRAEWKKEANTWIFLTRILDLQWLWMDGSNQVQWREFLEYWFGYLTRHQQEGRTISYEHDWRWWRIGIPFTRGLLSMTKDGWSLWMTWLMATATKNATTQWHPSVLYDPRILYTFGNVVSLWYIFDKCPHTMSHILWFQLNENWRGQHNIE